MIQPQILDAEQPVPGRGLSFNLVGALLISLLLLALTAVTLGAVQRFLPWWQPTYLLPACGLIAFEATYVQHMLRRERMWLAEGARYLLVELLVLAVLMRLASLAEVGIGDGLAWGRELLRDPLRFFDAAFLAYFAVGLAVGLLGHALASDLAALSPQEFERATDDDEANRRLLLQVGSDRIEALERLSGRFVAGGVLLLIGLALQSAQIEQGGLPPRPLSASAALAATGYFCCGFLLYSQGRLALLRSRWRLEGVAVAGGLGRGWTGASLLLISSVALAALALPRSYGGGLFDAAWLLLEGLSYVVVLVGYLLMAFMALLALLPALLLAWLGGGAAPPPPPQLPPPPLPPVELIERTPPLLPALVFWCCVAFLTGYGLWLFARRHQGLARLLQGSALARLWALLRGTLSDVAVWGGTLATAARSRMRPRRPVSRRRARRRGTLPPREAVRAFYQALLAQARRQGLPRARHQTPYEYGAELAQRLPEAAPEIAALTESFVVAEYGPRPVEPEAARAARRLWTRLVRLLRRA